MACATINKSVAVITVPIVLGLGVVELISRIEAAQPARPVSQAAQQARSQVTPPDPPTLVRRYETSLAPYSRMRGRWTLDLEESLNSLRQLKPGEADSRPNSKEEWAVFRDTDRLRLVQTAHSEHGQEVFEALWQGKQQVSKHSNGQLVARLQWSVESELEFLGSSLCSPCYGIIGSNWIPDFLKTAKTSVEEATLEGRPLYRLRALRMDAKIELWIDPSLNYAARRIRFDKRASEADSTVRSHQFDATRFRMVNSQYVATEATMTATRGPQPVFSVHLVEKIVKGKRVKTYLPARDDRGNVIVDQGRWTATITLREIDFDPKWTNRDFQFSRPIANGTRVAVQGAAKSRYEWKDGRVVLIAPDPALK